MLYVDNSIAVKVDREIMHMIYVGPSGCGKNRKLNTLYGRAFDDRYYELQMAVEIYNSVAMRCAFEGVKAIPADVMEMVRKFQRMGISIFCRLIGDALVRSFNYSKKPGNEELLETANRALSGLKNYLRGIWKYTFLTSKDISLVIDSEDISLPTVYYYPYGPKKLVSMPIIPENEIRYGRLNALVKTTDKDVEGVNGNRTESHKSAMMDALKHIKDCGVDVSSDLSIVDPNWTDSGPNMDLTCDFALTMDNGEDLSSATALILEPFAHLTFYKPRVLYLDEPFQGVEAHLKVSLIKKLFKVATTLGCRLCIATTDPEFVHLCDNKIVKRWSQSKKAFMNVSL